MRLSVPKVPGSIPLSTLFICRAQLHDQVVRGVVRGDGSQEGGLPSEGRGVAASQLDLPSLTSLCQLVHGSRFSTDRLLAIEDFTFTFSQFLLINFEAIAVVIVDIVSKVKFPIRSTLLRNTYSLYIVL